MYGGICVCAVTSLVAKSGSKHVGSWMEVSMAEKKIRSKKVVTYRLEQGRADMRFDDMFMCMSACTH